MSSFQTRSTIFCQSENHKRREWDIVFRYLGFLTGVVDSDSLPLNVGRETIQEHASLKTIRKKLVKKGLEIIKKLADEDENLREKGEKGSETYLKFWKEFGRAIRLGIVEDETNRNRLSKLLRFHTSKFTGNLTSLAGYVSRMKEGKTRKHGFCKMFLRTKNDLLSLWNEFERDSKIASFGETVGKRLRGDLFRGADGRIHDARIARI